MSNVTKLSLLKAVQEHLKKKCCLLDMSFEHHVIRVHFMHMKEKEKPEKYYDDDLADCGFLVKLD